MHNLKQNFTRLIVALIAVMACLIVFSVSLANKVQAAEPALPVPVSVNALMVTLIDHSAHYIWDYAAMTRDITDDEWRTIEYYAIQLAGSGPLITLGGTGRMDNTWASSSQWVAYSKIMSDAAVLALEASTEKDKRKLQSVGDILVDSCESCHALFKPEVPTEGIMHQPDYDYLYHLFR